MIAFGFCMYFLKEISNYIWSSLLTKQILFLLPGSILAQSPNGVTLQDRNYMYKLVLQFAYVVGSIAQQQ